MQRMFEQELELAKQAALDAGRIIKKHASTDFAVTHKGEGTDQPVTIADHESNDIIRKTLLAAFPNDGWLSEETLDNDQRLTNERVWIVDPLDGTKEFIKGIPEYAVSIALSYKGNPVVGVVMNPGTGNLFYARTGAGSFLNDKPIHVSQRSEISGATMLASHSELKRGNWQKHTLFNIVASGGLAHKMSQVACGVADASFSLDPKNEWDFAAGILLITEAGGKTSFPDGSEIKLNKANPKATGILYDNGSLHEPLLDYIRKI